jgi:glycerol dehydrogenase
MILEGRPTEELERVVGWCNEVGLPTRLDELGNIDKSQLPAAAKKSCDSSDTMSNMPFAVTPDMVLEAMGRADDISAELG